MGSSEEGEPWTPRILQGEPGRKAIVRGQDRTIISCGDDEFRDYLCMSTSDLERLFKECLEQQ